MDLPLVISLTHQRSHSHRDAFDLNTITLTYPYSAVLPSHYTLSTSILLLDHSILHYGHQRKLHPRLHSGASPLPYQTYREGHSTSLRRYAKRASARSRSSSMRRSIAVRRILRRRQLSSVTLRLGVRSVQHGQHQHKCA